MFRFLGRTLKKLVFYSVAAGALVGAWDIYTQAQAAPGDFSFSEYVASVSDRYGDDAIALSSRAVELGHSGWASGVTWVEDSGVLEQVGVSLPEVLIPSVPSEDVAQLTDVTDVADVSMAAESTTAADKTGAVVEVALANEIRAPETSLFPKARATD